MAKHIIVVGAGLSGLTLALSLISRGFQITVLERASELKEVGAGLTVYGASVAIYEQLGLLDALWAASNSVEGMAVLHYATGQSVVDQPPGPGAYNWASKSTSLTRTVHIHRADLQSILAKALQERAPEALRLGHRVTDVRTQDDQARVTLWDGRVLTGDLVVGCDGIKSVVRQSLFGPDALTFSGHVAFRCVMPAAPAKPFLSAGRVALTIGPGRTFQRYGLRDGAELNVVAFARTDAWLEEGWRIAATRREMRQFYTGWTDDTLGIIDAAPEDRLFKWGLFQREPLARWSKGRSVLVGDAAHPILPFLGLGAGKAIDDAVVLARALAQYSDVAEALAAYEDVRRDWTTLVAQDSATQGEALMGPEPQNFWSNRPPLRNRNAMSFAALDVAL